MEVRSGYKQTEAGVIPEEWVTSRLQDMVQANAPIAYGVLKPGDYVYGGVPLLQIRDVIHGDIDVDSLHRISDQLNRQFSRTKLVGGEIVVSLVGTIGRVAIIPRTLSGGNLHRNLARVQVARNHDPKFLCYFLCSDLAQAAIKLTTFGSTQALLNLADLRGLAILVPPLSEQRAIAVALSDVDGLLDGLDRLIGKKRDLKQAAMQQLLTGQTRLPGFRGEWEVKRLGDVVEIRKGHVITSDTTTHGEIPVIAGGKQPAYYHHVANRLGRTITISASGASAGYVALYNSPIFASDCSTISEGQSYSLDFIFYQLQLRQQLIYKAQTGGAQPHIHPVNLMPIKFTVPSLSEQIAIAAVLTEMDAEVAGLEQRRAKTRDLKQAMMQELLTGRTRLVSPKEAHA